MKKFCSTALISALLTGACFLSTASVAQAAEYRLIIGDSASCRANGKTGPDCVLPASAVASSTGTTSTTSTTSSTSSVTSSNSSSGGCVVTNWNPCSNSGSSPSSTSQTTVTSPPATTTTTVAQTSPPPAVSTTAVAGTLDFGSGGLDAGGATNRIEVTGGVTTLPFTTVPGRFYGKVSIVPTSSALPQDGTGIRMWWSKEKGGTALSSNCAANLRFEGAMSWSQENALPYGCGIPSASATLYLNLQACISARTDGTCSAADAKPGGSAILYIRGSKS